MQITTALLFAVATAASAFPIQAANCTTTDRNSIQLLPEFQAYQTACLAVITAKTTEADAQPNILCSDSACLKAMASLVTAMPRCEHAGSPLTAVLDEKVLACQAISNKTDAVSPPPMALAVASVLRRSVSPQRVA